MKKLFISAALSIFFLYAILVVSAFYFFDPGMMRSMLRDTGILHAISLSIATASLAAAISVMLAIPGAYALSRYRFPFRKATDIILEFPMIVSPAALGAILLIFFQTPAGLFFRENIMDVVYAFWGIVLAQFLTVLGISTRLIKSVFDEIPVRYEQIARTKGASASKAFFDISLPLAKNGILSAGVLSWAKAIGEFGATITIAGAMAGKTQTMPTAIFMKLSLADIKGTVVLIIILLSISISLLIITRLFLSKDN